MMEIATMEIATLQMLRIFGNTTGFDRVGSVSFICTVLTSTRVRCTARSVDAETRSDSRNANRNPEWWGNFSQLVEIGKPKFIGILRYKFKLRF